MCGCVCVFIFVWEKTNELCVGVVECSGTFGGPGCSSQVFHSAPPSKLMFLHLMAVATETGRCSRQSQQILEMSPVSPFAFIWNIPRLNWVDFVCLIYLFTYGKVLVFNFRQFNIQILFNICTCSGWIEHII